MNDREKLKKDIELFQISWLLTYLSIDLDNVIKYEGPDFVINYKGRRVGLEVETCHSQKVETNSKLCEAETRQCLYKILNEYKTRISNWGEHSKSINVSFTEKIYGIRNLKKIKERIFKEIDSQLICGRSHEWKDCEYVNNVTEYPLPFNFIEVTMSDACWSTPVKWSNILYCINQKETKLSDYRARTANMNIAEYWLVIDFIHDRDTDIRCVQTLPFETKYDRIYLTKYNDIKRLK